MVASFASLKGAFMISSAFRWCFMLIYAAHSGKGYLC